MKSSKSTQNRSKAKLRVAEPPFTFRLETSGISRLERSTTSRLEPTPRSLHIRCTVRDGKRSYPCELTIRDPKQLDELLKLLRELCQPKSEATLKRADMARAMEELGPLDIEVSAEDMKEIEEEARFNKEIKKELNAAIKSLSVEQRRDLVSRIK